jgi:hypothetical protein
MRNAIWAIAPALALALAGCYVDSGQLVEASLFNQPAAKVRACFGRPDQRISVGVEQIWVYRVGHLVGEGWVPALGQDERPTFSAADGNCEARFTIDSHGLRGVAYADSLGRPIPQAERCEIAVRRCLGDPRS